MMQLSVYKEHYKETIRLGVPIMLGQLGIIVVGFADNIMVGTDSHHRRVFCAERICKGRRDTEKQPLYQPHRGIVTQPLHVDTASEHPYPEAAGRVDALYRALLYPATLLGHFRHAVQLVQAVQRRHDRHGHPDVRHVRSQRAQHHRELLADIRQLRMS